VGHSGLDLHHKRDGPEGARGRSPGHRPLVSTSGANPRALAITDQSHGARQGAAQSVYRVFDASLSRKNPDHLGGKAC
jgi:hypothetical protein